MNENESRSLTAAESESQLTLQELLRKSEDTFNREILGWAVTLSSADASVGVNSFNYRHNPQLRNPSDISIATFEEGPNAYSQALNIALNSTAIAYGVAIVGGARKNILVYRPGRSLVFTGKMSTFGGPHDSGMREDEGLAIVGVGNMAAIVAKHAEFSGGLSLFLPSQASTSLPLGRNLNPEAYYVACRWDYEADIARNDLVSCNLLVKNKLTGASHLAVATDWGPHQRTGRIADLSPGLAKKLNLRTDDECIVSVTGPKIKPVTAPSPAGSLTPKGGPANLKVFTQAELEQNFGKITPVQENGDGSFRIMNPNFSANLDEADLTGLIGIRGVPNDGMVRCHTAIKRPLESAINEIIAGEMKSLILTWDGLFVPRHILWDQSRGFSTHSWGIAFDINVRWNGYGSKPAASGTTGSVMPLVPIFEKHGFAWGGRWRTPDGMHFQYGR